MKNKLNLDIYRLIASFLIIAIHVYPFESINLNLDFLFTHVFCRIGVPFFLMLTGYFIIDKSLKDKQILISYTKKIILIYLISIIIYIPINIYAGSFNNLNILKLLKMIFIDGTMYHLWYFPGLILGLWFTYFLLKRFNKKYVLSTILLLYILGLLGDNYYGLIENIKVLKTFYNYIFKIFDYTRNGLFYCPIFIYIGYTFSKKETNINKKELLLTIIFIILMLLEGLIIKYFNLSKHDSMYILLIPLVYYIFKILLSYNNGKNRKIRSITTILYITHPFFIVIIRLIGKILNLTNIIVKNSLIHYLLVSIITLIFSYTLIKLHEIYKQKKSK